MKSNGWETEISPPGRIAKQMVKSLSGIKMLSILSHEDILSLLYSMENGKSVKKVELFTKISKMINKGRILRDKTRIVELLLNANMIRLGMELQCPICQQHSWYSICDIEYDVTCPKCSGEYSVPSHDPEKMKWAYRTYGPFSLPSSAYGVYSVLLTLRFISQLLADRPVTPMLSFMAKKDDINIEVDLSFEKDLQAHLNIVGKFMRILNKEKIIGKRDLMRRLHVKKNKLESLLNWAAADDSIEIIKKSRNSTLIRLRVIATDKEP
jgi:hypothetical protein